MKPDCWWCGLPVDHPHHIAICGDENESRGESTECSLCGRIASHDPCWRCEESECAECGCRISGGYFCGGCASGLRHDGGLYSA